MLYDDLRKSYGNHVAKRVQAELSSSEFEAVAVDELQTYLEMRADACHKEYQAQLACLPKTDPSSPRRLWREAEDLAYLIAVAEDVSSNLRRVAE